MNRFNLQLFAVDEKTIKAADLAKARDVDFTERFTADIGTLMKMLGVTRKIEKKAQETLKVYKVTGTLESGTVAEGEVIRFPSTKPNTRQSVKPPSTSGASRQLLKRFPKKASVRLSTTQTTRC